ncbi:helix-turn-helix domain-containing protein [Ramlibacter alkalitolerans]|uniref:Helix-turn-helix domain-containing protein n=1 Tax=Ramlibacter alkalitolerans TaxID=2039631 RepID=A0ABS1JH07_9BURK|nr:helix-turn-helix domain-containing protein [Ramlibacter alkalitolerans]MBL0423515.1 helix-turn-helix domain-containing protein [Ramlibacter alkalitolerans]
MDALIAASARALAAGDALVALKHVALRDDPPALALRGIAMARLGELARSRELLRRAARAFGHEELARARCVLADAEVALAMRDLAGPARTLAAACATFEKHGDRANALHARLIAARRLLLLGRLADAAATLGSIAPAGLPASSVAVAELTAAELALRSLRCGPAAAALARADQAAYRAGIPALIAEVAEARAALERPAARRIAAGRVQSLRLHEVEACLASGALVLDACRRGLAGAGTWQPLARRPILFALARMLAEAWPQDVERDALIATAFRTRRPDETHRARLRVEIGRLRRLLQALAAIEATPRGFVLQPRDGREVVVLAPPVDGEQASLLALLSDGAAWSTSALALALGASQRTVQRAVSALETSGQLRGIGQARARRWLAAPLVGFTTILLLPASLPAA